MTNNPPGWKRMRFKKNKVWLAVDPNEKPVVRDGKVLIKYQLDQEHEYWVHQNNVKPLKASSVISLPDKDKKIENGKTFSRRKATGSASDKISLNASKDTIHVYTDGASAGNPGPSGIGIVLRFGQHEKEISKYIGMATNNIAELEAIREGLLQIKQTHLPVRIFTDSRYAQGVLSLGWKARKNKEIIQSIKKAMSAFSDIKLIKVKGHGGIEGNERADVLATSAIEKAT
jgi:ribonuclease HI